MLSVFAANAQEISHPRETFDPALILMANLREGSTAERYLSNLRVSLSAVDSDANGLDPEDVRRLERQEIERALAAYSERRRQAQTAMARIDSDSNGSIPPAFT